ncbi:MAG: HMG-box domain-containing protein [Archaeoglobaceae archaeon]
MVVLKEEVQSMLSPKVKKILLKVIDEETEKAIKENDMNYLTDLQNAKKLILRGAWKTRKANPYLLFTQQCMLSNKPQRKLTLKEVQELMKECAEKWRQLPESEKKKYKVLAGEVMVYDYL